MQWMLGVSKDNDYKRQKYEHCASSTRKACSAGGICSLETRLDGNRDLIVKSGVDGMVWNGMVQTAK